MSARAPLSYPGHARALLVLGGPLIASHLAQMLLHVTDTVMLGWYGVSALAAVVLGSSAFFIVFILGSGFGIAVMGLVSSALGAGDTTQVRRDTRMGLWLSGFYGIAVMPLMWWSGPILLAAGQQPDVAALAQEYLRIAGFGMVPALLIMVLKSYLAAFERTQVVLAVTLVSVALNFCLNWMLIFGNWGAPELGVQGAAIATLSVQITGMALLAAYSGWQPALRQFELFHRFWRPDWQAMRKVFRLGLPIGLTGLAEGGLFQASALMMGWLGVAALAAHGIALELAALTFMVHLGLSNAATVRVGRADGARDTRGLRDAALTATVLSLAVAVVGVALFLAMPETLVALFLDAAKPGSAEIIAFGAKLLAVAALFQMFDAMQVMALGLLRGVQDTRVPMWLASISYWLIGIPASYVLAFPLGLGGVGLWFGLVVGLACAATLLMARFWRGRLAL
ncbi:MATE family efflux transporter [Phaeovulum sp.]|uniref:MATE family efflux transporter n=1 Tax=Phaeovulum sp. TaxID=2934796 RepID=UPI00272F3D62|nr:MATE family efflux transporter [Phaeovulum sp.]MDP1668493.1 MATE family efflux transporter [Phaeovulum sp.]MDZ4118776.1 MATE family efflux transporter [Phaeovulum sp.]